MKKKNDHATNAASLRQKAEEHLKKRKSKTASVLSEADMLKQFHELEVRQIELEMQNEELVSAKEKNAELKKSADELNKFTEDIIDTIREPLLAIDEDLRVIKASRSFYKFFKVAADETIGKLIYELGNHQWDIPKLRELLEEIIPKKNSFDNYEVEHHFSTIGRRVMLLNARQVKWAFGQEKVILLAIEDITERKDKEDALKITHRATSDSLNILLNHTHAPLIIWDTSFIIRRFNRKFEQLSGYDAAEVIDKKIDFLFPKDKIAATLELLKNHVDDEHFEVVEIDILTKDNNIKTVLWDSAPILDEEGKNIIATISQDITSRKLLEDTLTHTETRYRRLFESAKDGIIILDAETGKIVDVNPFLINLLGYSKKELIEKFIWEIGAFQDIYENKEKFLELQQEEYVRYEDLPLVTSDGREIHVEFISSVYLASNMKAIQCNIRDNTENWQIRKQIVESEEKIRNINAGLEIKVKERTNQLSEINEMLQNEIEERKTIEKKLKEANKEAERAYLAKSEFLSRMSHELRTPMNSILGFTQLMEMEELAPVHKKGVNHILTSGKHLLNLINEVLDLSRIEAGKLTISLEPVSVYEIITETLDVVQPLANDRNIVLELINLSNEDMFVKADNQRLKQVLLNLVNNAVKFNRVGGSVKVQCSKENGVRISVIDTGYGIKPEDLDKLFNPFQRIGAKVSEIEGTGLGLAVAKKLMEAMHGKIGVESKVGVGSTFWIELPQAEGQNKYHEKNSVTERTKAETANASVTGTILYIEDNISNQQLVEQILNIHRPSIHLITEMYGKNAVKLAKDYKPALVLLDSRFA
ncbi:MAG: PAS domain S-box protein [Bacteroidales bacterium]|nr:PAS domain S-box protein [Bacteroidales bacterium]